MNRAERRSVASRTGRPVQAARRRIVVFASLGILAIVVIAAIVYANRVPQTASSAPISAQLTVGEPAPEFAVSTTDGAFDLARARGEPTLLEVFASWCPHCQHETAVLNGLYDAYRNRVHFVAVSGSPYDMSGQAPESQADVVAFVQRFHVRYPVAFDGNLSVAKLYLQGGFPTLVLISPQGKIQAFTSGQVPEEDVAAALAASVAGRKPNASMSYPQG